MAGFDVGSAVGGASVGAGFGPLGAAIGGVAGGFLGGGSKGPSSWDLMQEQIKHQTEFAKMGVRWRVADAIEAGIHPLFALGAQLPQYSPVHSVGGEDDQSFLARHGQDIGRAIQATRTEPERVKARMAALAIERGELENQILRADLAKKQQVGPGFPGTVEVQPLKPTATDPGQPHKDAYQIPDIAFARTRSGGLAVVPSKDVKERIEDQAAPQAAWMFRNLMVPFWKEGPRPDTRIYPTEPGYVWDYNPFLAEWEQVPARDVLRRTERQLRSREWAERLRRAKPRGEWFR